jgi:2-polyprenyl-3-methyl-5-hydroxy-6-metoxy-1,4-benzoquinol methylase
LVAAGATDPAGRDPADPGAERGLLERRRHRMATTEMDATAAERFAGRMLDTLNGSMLSLMISVGHQTRLLDTMAELPPQTSEQIAQRAGLQERYVREWLGGMTVGGILEHDPAHGTYRLPAEHAACLTRAAGPGNLASMMQMPALFGELEQQVIACFRDGGGVPYSAMPRFQALMAEDSAQVQDAALVEVTLPLVDGLVDRLRSGIDVVDVGCGHGHAANLIAAAFPASRVTGIDISHEGITAGAAEAERLGLRNVAFEERDGESLAAGAYDLVTAFDVVHDLPRPSETLSAIHAALRPGGVFLMVDIAASSHVHENVEHPLGPTLYASSIFHCMTVSLSQGGAGLGTVWGEQLALELLGDAGFRDVEIQHVDADIVNSYYVARKD